MQVLHGLGSFLRLRYLRSLPLSPTGRGLPVPFLLRSCWWVCGGRCGDHVVVRLLVLRCCVWLHVWVRPRRVLLLLLLLRLLLLWFGWLCLVILLRLLRLLRRRHGGCNVSRAVRGGHGLRSACAPGGVEDHLQLRRRNDDATINLSQLRISGGKRKSKEPSGRGTICHVTAPPGFYAAFPLGRLRSE